MTCALKYTRLTESLQLAALLLKIHKNKKVVENNATYYKNKNYHNMIYK